MTAILSFLASQLLKALVTTLTHWESKKELDGRPVIVLTQCTDAVRRSLWGPLLKSELYRKFKLCHVPVVWYDDFNSEPSLKRFTGRSAWRDQFQEWLQELPGEAMDVPSESERESLKREHKESLKRQQDHIAALKEELGQTKEAHHSLKSTEQRQQ